MDIQPPKGFNLDPASGLYYLQTIEKDANGNDVKAIIWLNLQTGEHRKQYYPVTPQPAPAPAPVPNPVPAAAPVSAAYSSPAEGYVPAPEAVPRKKSKVGMILGIVFGSAGLITILVVVGVILAIRHFGCISPYGGFNGNTSVSHGGGSDGGPINPIGDSLPEIDELPGVPGYNWDDEDPYNEEPEDVEEPEEEEPDSDDDIMQGDDIEARLKLDSDEGGYSIDDPVPGTFRPDGNTSPKGWGIGYCFGFYYVKAQTDAEYGAYGNDYISYIQLNNDGTYEMYCSAGGDSWWWDGEFTMTDKNYEMDEIFIYLYDAYNGMGERRTAVFAIDEGAGCFLTEGFGYMGENYGTEDEPLYFFTCDE